MTPDITPFLQAADRDRPDLKITNTAASCAELLQLTLKKAGDEWAFIAKSNKDGGQVTPSWFQSFERDLTRPDGQVERVRFTGVSMDAAWHVPSMRQVKVIANSSANDDPDPAIHGPAKLTPYLIDPAHYRWYNPPLAQPGGAQPGPVPPPATMPSYEDLGGDAYWRAEIGVPLQADMAIKTPFYPDGQTLNDGSSVWFARPIFRILDAYAKGQTPDRAAIIKSVRNEWRGALGLPPL